MGGKDEGRGRRKRRRGRGVKGGRREEGRWERRKGNETGRR